MVDNQHKLIQGYRDLSDSDIELINEIKQAELALGELWKHVGSEKLSVDQRFMSIAKIHFQEGFSAFVRAVAKPADPFS